MKNKTIKLSEMLAWCFKHFDTFPIESDFWTDGSFANDHPPCELGIDPENLCNVTKSDFATYTGKQLPQISRWLKAGMPERKDGRLDFLACNKWLDAYEKECRARQDNGWR